LNRFQIARRYSRSIIEGNDLDRIPSIVDELRGFNTLIEGNRQLKVLFVGMIFEEKEKVSAFDALRPHLKISDPVAKYLRMMIIRNHLSALSETVEALTALYNEKKKRAKAVVITPVPVDLDYSERIKETLSTITGREIEIENIVDPTLIGGFIVKVGSMIFDSSLKGQIRLLRAALLK